MGHVRGQFVRVARAACTDIAEPSDHLIPKLAPWARAIIFFILPMFFIILRISEKRMRRSLTSVSKNTASTGFTAGGWTSNVRASAVAASSKA
jgi:hypothetical protein